MAKIKILVIDDDQDYRAMLMEYLEPAGYLVIEAENGEQAKEFLKSEQNKCEVDLILCEIRMPRIDGIETIRSIKMLCPGIPIIAIYDETNTTLVSQKNEEAFLDFFIQPVEKRKLLEAKYSFLGNGKREKVNFSLKEKKLPSRAGVKRRSVSFL